MGQQEMTLEKVINNLLDEADNIDQFYDVQSYFGRTAFDVKYLGNKIHADKLSAHNLQALLNDAYNNGKRAVAIETIRDLIDIKCVNEKTDIENLEWDTGKEIGLEDEDLEDLISCDVGLFDRTLNREEIRSLAAQWDKHRKTCLEKNQKFVRVSISSKSISGLGIGTTARCDCGFEMDITDYAAW